MAKTGKTKGGKLSLTREHVSWIYDILVDYTLQLMMADEYYKVEKSQLEERFKDEATTAEESKQIAEMLDKLEKDRPYVEIATRRHKEIKDIVENFLGITPTEDVKEDNGSGDEGANIGGDESVHSVGEEKETSN